MRLLTLRIQEPLPGKVLPSMAGDHGAEEAARRYRAIAVTTLRQLHGLADARIRILAEPDDAAEAIRFWLLPRLADRWQADGPVFRNDGWEIDFGGGTDDWQIECHGEILCPMLGARWVHTALLGTGSGCHRVIGPAQGGGEYFRAESVVKQAEPIERILPELPVIRNDGHWRQALDGPLGAALKKAWEEEK